MSNRKKQKIVKFLEIEQIKDFEQPIVEKVKNVLSKTEEITTMEKIAIRDFAVISLVYACALRISEATKLQKHHINLSKKEMTVFDGKGGDRIVPIPEPIIKALKEWEKVRPEWKNNPYYFTNVKGTTRPGKIRPMTTKYYNQLFDKLAKTSGVTLNDGNKPHPHTLRHSRAMELFDNHTDLEVIQQFLGHRNLSTTQVYAQVRHSRVVEAQQTALKGLVTI